MEQNDFINTLAAIGGVSNKEINYLVHLSQEDKDFVSIENEQYIVENCSFSEPFEIFNLKFDNQTVFKFVKCTFSGKANFTFISVKCRQILFEDCVFEGEVYFSNIDAPDVFFDSCDIHKLIFRYNSVNHLRINNREAGEIDSIDFNSEKTGYFQLYSKSTIRNLNLNEGHEIDIHTSVDQLVVWGDNYQDLLIGSELMDMPIKIQQLKISNAQFDGFITVQCADIHFLDLGGIKTQKGTLILNELNIRKFSMEDCHIQNIQFSVVDFIEECSIIRSNIEGIKLFNVSWLKDRRLTPDYIALKTPWLKHLFKKDKRFEYDTFDTADLVDLKYQRDAFRQLKGASAKSHNQVDALAFYKNETHLYWKEILLVGGESRSDTFLIFLNRVVSNFGQNWLRPLLLLFVVHFLLFLSIHNWNIWGNELNMGMEVKEYFYLFNPVHKTPDYINTGWGYFTEFIMRASVGYFSFHFIKASRKFGR